MGEKAIKTKLIYGWDDKRTIYLLYRDESDMKVIKSITDFEWYFCVYLSDYKKAGKEIFQRYFRLGVVKRLSGLGTDYVKIYCHRHHDLFNSFITELKGLHVQCLEMDLSLTKRYMIDNQVELEENLKIGYFDIETDDRGGGIEIGRDKILSWAIVDEKKRFYFSSDNEEELLIKFLNTMDRYDVLVGWNSSNFDIPYLQMRCEKYGLSYRKKDGVDIWRRTMQVDLMMRYVKLFAPIMSILNLSGFSLNEFSKVFLNRQKVEHSEKIYEMFESNPEKLKEYNVNDCLLVMELNQKMNTLPLMIKECVWTGSFLDKFYVGELLDNYILRESKKAERFLPSRPNKEEEAINRRYRITGGYVKEPLVGYYSNVRVFDFKSLYPTIMIGYNLGDDTLVRELSWKAKQRFDEWLADREIEKVDFDEWLNFLVNEKKALDPDDRYYQSACNQFFRKERPSVVSDLLKNLLQQRKEWKKKMDSFKEGSTEFANARASQEVIKELANSMFGITADASSRYYNTYFSESITYTGQFWNRLSSKLLKERLGVETLYADTDSVFVVVDSDEEVEKIHEQINSMLNEETKKLFSLHPDKDLIDLEYEKKYAKLILLDKKRYIGKLIWSNGKNVDFIHSRGTENVKKDTIKFTKNVLLEIVQKIINGLTLDEAVEQIKILQLKIKNREIPADELVIVKKLSKPFSEYKSTPMHVRLAMKLFKEKKILDTIKRRKVSWGERISFIVLDAEDKENGIVLASEWDGKKLDTFYYWRVHIFSPLCRILKVVYPDFNWEIYREIPEQDSLF